MPNLLRVTILAGLSPLALAFAVVLAAAGAHGAVPSVVASANSCALDVAGAVHCWGSNRYGALGQATSSVQAAPAAVQGLAGATASIATGQQHTCAIDSAGGVQCWGNNRYGQLGNGSFTDSSVPVPVTGLGSGARAIFANLYYACALLDSGALTCWGGGGQLGGPVDVTPVPRPVAGLPSGVVTMSAGVSHACVLTSQGSVWCWGSNFAGQLGDGTIGGEGSRVPRQVTGLASGVAAIAGSGNHTCAAMATGAVMCWGQNRAGSLGDGTLVNRGAPVQVQGLSGIASVAAGLDHSCALSRAGDVSCWGDNGFFELGNGPGPSSPVPVNVATLRTGVVALTSAAYGTCAITSDARVLCWGYNAAGQMGDGTTSTVAVPTPVVGAIGIRMVATGGEHTCVLTVSSAMFCWGSAANGALGTATLQNSATPLTVLGLPPDLVTIGTGEYHTCGLRSGGGVVCWGSNYFGQSGNNAPIAVAPQGTAVPVSVPELPSATQLAVGTIHNCIVSTASEAWCWGNNREGQLGDGNSGIAQFRSTPVRVAGLAAVRAVGAGLMHSCAIDAAGGVWCWGANSSGQLGNGSRTDSPNPVRVSGLQSGVVAISLGWYSTCALSSAGGISCWGQGHGTTPAGVAGLSSGVSAVSVGGSHACALKTDRNIYCWGSNSQGQLGDGTTAARETPAPIAAFQAGASAIAAGVNHTCAIVQGGIVACWGGNENGELGDGTFAVRSLPAVVLRDGGAGNLPANDWYLDLQPSVPKTIPPDRIPAFLAVAAGSIGTSISAQVRFRPQDVGKRIHVFAYAPSAIAKRDRAGKEGENCVLAQLTSSGLQQVSASNLASTATGVQSTQQQSVSILNNVSATQVAGATFCVGVGQTGGDAIAASNNQCVVTVPGNNVCLPDASASFGVAANVPGAYSGLWWNASESGWGINFTQRSGNVFVAWYTYDAAGNPKWYVASNCALVGSACSAPLYEVSATRFFGASFNPALTTASQAGSLQLSFQDTARANLTYTLGNQTRNVPITRQLAQGPAPGSLVDYTDLWWNPAESGWGAAMTQYGNQIFLAWYVYDSAGKPTWYVTPNCVLTAAATSCAGKLYRTTGPAFGPTFNAAQVQAFEAGDIAIEFSDGNNGRLSYTVNGVQAAKAITRQLF